MFMKNKKWLLLLIIALPSALWVILETSTINSKKLPFYGPKSISGSTGDTIYYKVDLDFYSDQIQTNKATINTKEYPIVALMFVKSSYKSESFRLAGLWEYINYKKEKVKDLPVFIVAENVGGTVPVADSLKRLTSGGNLQFLNINQQKFDSVNKTFFRKKPYYIDYSFIVLLDENRNIRGFYDARYVAEVKRLLDEFKHLRLKEAKKELIKDNEIKINK
jgi:hypothetical protein